MRKLKTEYEDYLVIDDVLFRIKIPKDKSIEPLLLLVIPEPYVPTIPYQYHDSLLAGHQGFTRMYLNYRRNSMLTTYLIPSESMYKFVIHVIQDLLRNQVARHITQELPMNLDLCLEYQQA